MALGVLAADDALEHARDLVARPDHALRRAAHVDAPGCADHRHVHERDVGGHALGLVGRERVAARFDRLLAS